MLSVQGRAHSPGVAGAECREKSWRNRGRGGGETGWGSPAGCCEDFGFMTLEGWDKNSDITCFTSEQDRVAACWG